jgi:hypothetical protein
MTASINSSQTAIMTIVVASRATKTSITTISITTREGKVRRAMGQFHPNVPIGHQLTAEQRETPPPARL